MKMIRINDATIRDLSHYILVFGAIALAWVPIMSAMGGNVPYTATIVLGIFIAVDKIAHKVLKVK
jgi:hypothetical protein